jgi:hypothetical protein
MATRGAKPKPAKLRLVDGTNNVSRHGTLDKARAAVDAAQEKFGNPVKPKTMRGEAAKAWDRYIKPASWLDGAREAAAIAFCELWDEFRSAPIRFPASKHGQLRAYMNELGLTDERNRGDADDSASKDEHFD